MINTNSPCTAIAAQDIINSATPLETSLLGQHPRLLCVDRPWDQWPARLETTPWKEWFVSLRKSGDAALSRELPEKLMGQSPSVFDARHLGEQLMQLALLYRLTEAPDYRDRCLYLMERMAGEPDWGSSLIYGHWARGFAIALDWLWHDIDTPLRSRHVETLYKRTRHVFDEWASYRAGDPFGYTWNIAAVVLGGITATAACLYGERPDVAPLANMAHEKMRCQSLALGPDGISPEGIMYGGYYTSYLIVNFMLADQLLGGDLCGTTPWLTSYAGALHAQSLPRAFWKSNDAFFMQGDAHGNVFGLESVLRMIAAAARNETAQWMADQLLESGLIGAGTMTFLFHDPTVKAVAPADQAPFDCMPDFGIAIMRSDRSGKENAAAFKCSPNVGHHAARRFTHPLGGGHMHPNNGEIQIHAHGEWILVHPGYVYKDTAYHNTLLIDGRGQYGDQSEWFEDLPYRQRQQYPCMERMEHHGQWDYCVANLLNAYPVELGLTILRRHLVYLRPATWILIDALESQSPVTPTALFHTGFALQESGAKVVAGRGEHAACTIRFHAPDAIDLKLEDQIRLHTGGNPEGTLHLVRMSPTQPTQRHLGIIEIQAFAVSGKADPAIEVQRTADNGSVAIQHPSLAKPITVNPFG